MSTKFSHKKQHFHLKLYHVENSKRRKHCRSIDKTDYNESSYLDLHKVVAKPAMVMLGALGFRKMIYSSSDLLSNNLLF